MSNTVIVESINENLTDCQTKMEEIAKLLSGLDSDGYTDKESLPIFVIMFDRFLMLQSRILYIQILLDEIKSQVNNSLKVN